MTSTNRFANRILLLLVGLVLLACGLAAIAVVQTPVFTTAWNRDAPDILQTLERFLQTPAVPGTSVAWVLVDVVGVAVVVIVLLVGFIAGHGHGHTRELIVQQTSDSGTTIIEAQVAAELLRDVLSGEPEILAVRVTASAVAHTSALKITVVCRRGASPRNISSIIEQSVGALDETLGVAVPVLVQLAGGIRTRLASSARFATDTSAPGRAAPDARAAGPDARAVTP